MTQKNNMPKWECSSSQQVFEKEALQLHHQKLLEQYSSQVPRYTSYPSVPFWSGAPLPAQWLSTLNESLQIDPDFSVYIHLPFCESLCGFCGCHKVITKNHDSESDYINAVLNEWSVYTQSLEQQNLLPRTNWKVLHLGGGTPTFFSAAHLNELMEGLFKSKQPSQDALLSFEAHPESTTREHLVTLKQHGFRRLSLGIQDFSTDIQEIISRKQSLNQIKKCINTARDLGYNSINFDLIYGLPKQTLAHMHENIKNIADLKPDRIALYSYAHVPWIKPSQRKFSDGDLPGLKEKIGLFVFAREALEDLGYMALGLDHFALPGDLLFESKNSHNISRNFMGYCEYRLAHSIALGISAIGENPYGYVQNHKSLAHYISHFSDSQKQHMLLFENGHILSARDKEIKTQIHNVMCHGETLFSLENSFIDWEKILIKLKKLETDGLVEVTSGGCKATETGQLFLRQIAAAFDEFFEFDGVKKQFSSGV